MRRWAWVSLASIWFLVNLISLETVPNLFYTGDEAWLVDISQNLLLHGKIASALFPGTGLEQGYGLVSQWIFHFLQGLVVAGFNGLLAARIPSLVFGLCLLLILAPGSRNRGLEKAWLVLAASPSFLLSTHIARPEALGLLWVGLILLAYIHKKHLLGAVLAGLGFFISPATGLAGTSVMGGYLFTQSRVKELGLCFLGFGLSLGLGTLIAGSLGGFHLLETQVHANYHIPLLHKWNQPLILAKAVAKKTYWWQFAGLSDPGASLFLLAGLLISAFRFKNMDRNQKAMLAGLVLWPVLAGLSVSRTPSYYFVYPSMFAVLLGAYGLSRLNKSWFSWGLVILATVFNATKTGLWVENLPASDPAGKLACVSEKIPDGSVVLGPVQDLFLFPNALNISPLALEGVSDTGRAFAMLDAMGPDFVVLTSQEGLLMEYARIRGIPLLRADYSGYASTREGVVRISALELFGLGRSKSWPGQHLNRSRPLVPSRQRQSQDPQNPPR